MCYSTDDFCILSEVIIKGDLFLLFFSTVKPTEIWNNRRTSSECLLFMQEKMIQYNNGICRLFKRNPTELISN
jgi:hypothetical protein